MQPTSQWRTRSVRIDVLNGIDSLIPIIAIPAAILKSPFFDKERPTALNYGGIGVIIGHELTHGFDTTGSKFDKDGNIKNWWSQDTLTKFNSRAKCFVTQYGQLVEPQTRMHINGQLTVGENIADNGGVCQCFMSVTAIIRVQSR